MALATGWGRSVKSKPNRRYRLVSEHHGGHKLGLLTAMRSVSIRVRLLLPLVRVHSHHESATFFPAHAIFSSETLSPLASAFALSITPRPHISINTSKHHRRVRCSPHIVASYSSVHSPWSAFHPSIDCINRTLNIG